jgi:hypothetical protein
MAILTSGLQVDSFSRCITTIQRSASDKTTLCQNKQASNHLLVINWHDDTFHRYTSGRWLFNEPEQLADRYVNFDMNELVRATAKCLGSDISACTNVQKLPEGNYNKVFLLTMSDGQQAVAKVPNPNAGRPFYTTASEVATMDFVS